MNDGMDLDVMSLLFSTDAQQEQVPFAEGCIDAVSLFDETTAVPNAIIDESVYGGSTISITGWAIDLEARAPVEGVCVRVGDTLVKAAYGELRRDIAAKYGQEFAFCGFRAFVPLPPTSDGRREISAIVVDRRAEAKYILQGARTIVVAPAILKTEIVNSRQHGAAVVHLDGCRVDNGIERIITRDMHVMRGSLVEFRGWAYDGRARLPARAVYALLDENDFVRGVAGQMRPDVAQTFGIEALARTGFSVRIDTAALIAGSHAVRITILTADGSGYDFDDSVLTFNVTPSQR